MLQWLGGFGAVQQAAVCHPFHLGASRRWARRWCFFFKSINKKVLNGMLGFAAGVMIAASFWSLLAPGIEMAEELGQVAFLTAAIGFLAGGGFLYMVDKLLPHLHMGLDTAKAEGIKTSWQRSVLLVSAITLHNIPEGLAVGVAFGAVAAGVGTTATLAGAVALAIGHRPAEFPGGRRCVHPAAQGGL